MATSAAPIAARWEAAARLVAEHRDVLDARPDEAGDPPAALVTRGWAEYLLACDDALLASFEIGGHEATWPESAPASLADLSKRAREVCDVPAIPLAPAPSTAAALRRYETPRKSAQIDAFAHVVLPLAAKAERVVDVGSGHGHLTRAVAERLALPVIGLERDATLAERARRLASSASPSFAQTDVIRDGLAVASGDCVIGLHACGELGDAMVESVARHRGSIALVGCCLQKRSTLTRVPLSGVFDLGDALELPRDLLGLSNLTARDEGVEATRAENLAGRERRLALHRLLSASDHGLRLGAEIDGLNRRAAQGDLASLVARAFALRGLPQPSPLAIDEAAQWSRIHHARARRLSLPRALLARVLEVTVLFDRARFLEERGYVVRVGTLFPPEVSARNLVLLARVTSP